MTKKRGSKERGKKARSLGALAEDMFSYFASQLDLVATKSQRDWEGWDLASDIPCAVIDPWGLPTPPLICRFQIKATETAKRTVRLRRENVLRMAQQPIPWFLMLVTYSKRTAQKIDLVHVGKDVVEDMLRWAITEPKATGFQLACDARGLEIDPTPEAWFAAIEQGIGEKTSYLARKAEWNDNAGRSQPRFQFNIESRSNTVDEMADFFLGLAPSMRVDSARIFEERFGIRQLRQDIGEGKMEIDPLAPSARVLLAARSPNQVASVDCQLFSTYPWIPASHGHRMRLRMRYFDMVLASADDKTRISFDFPEVMDLAAAAEEVRFFHVLHSADEVTITSGDKVVPLPAYKFPWTSSETDFFQAVTTTHQLFTTLGLRTSKFKLTGLLRGEALALARAILGDPKAKILSLTFRNGPGANPPSVVVSAFAVQDDLHRTGFVIRFDGRTTEDGRFEVRSMRSIDRFAFATKSAAERVAALLKQHSDHIEVAEGVFVTYLVDS